MFRLGIVAMFALAAPACMPATDNSPALEALMEVDRAFSRETGERGTDGWMRYFADDAVMFQGGSLVNGREEIRNVMSRVFADSAFSLQWEPQRARVSLGSDLGYTVGRYRATRAETGAPDDVQTGSYVTIWQKQSDGSWLAVLDMGNPDAPGPTAPN